MKTPSFSGAARVSHECRSGVHPLHRSIRSKRYRNYSLSVYHLGDAVQHLGRYFVPNVNDNIIIPGGAVFSLIFIWVAAHVGATVASVVNVPPLLGMLLSGLLLRNVPGGLVEALPNEWSSATRAAGLSVILMRSGLELDLVAFKRVGLACGRGCGDAGLSEAIATGFVATALFDLSVPLGLSLGFILAAVSPAVVVGGMFDLQARGWDGVERYSEFSRRSGVV